MGKFKDKIFELISYEPKTPTEISIKLGINQKTVQSTLFQLILANPEVIGYKKVGRTHLFWRKR